MMSASGANVGPSQHVAFTSSKKKVTPPLYRSRSSTQPQFTESIRVAEAAEMHRNRLYQLFGLIEKEFESLFAENIALHAKVEALTEKLTEGGALAPDKAAEILDITAADVVAAAAAANKGATGKKASQVGQKLKTALRVPPGRLVSSFKAGVGVGNVGLRTRYVRKLDGHRDGVWHVDTAPTNRRIVATASADQTARIWCGETGQCLVQYTGHSGSVNSVRMSPISTGGTNELMIVTASGDQSAHVWKTIPILPTSALAKHHHSSEDELDPLSEKDDNDDGEVNQTSTIRNASVQLTGHTGVVICADWLCGGDQVITASWDRSANIYDAERGHIINILSGHDLELNHCQAHPSSKLVVTSSKDTTFRLWDFRDAIQSVAVFQGHSESVTSTVFSGSDKLVSGSDDRTVKVWDLKNMRAPLATVRLDSPVNRLSVSPNQSIIAIPHDNRHVRLYDLNGIRLARLPRSNRWSHRRMVCCTAWGDEHNDMSANLFTAGFDKLVLAWKVTSATNKD